LIRCSAIGAPMMPRPMKPSFCGDEVMFCSLS
jgi:hypothetical protein